MWDISKNEKNKNVDYKPPNARCFNDHTTSEDFYISNRRKFVLTTPCAKHHGDSF
jgi:hypothetical protein